MDIKVNPIYRIFVEDVLNTFYLFQCFSLTVWYIDGFWMYATTLGFMLLISIYGELSTMYSNLFMLSEMARYECQIKVRRNSGQGNTDFKEINSTDLVPGDVFVIPLDIPLP